MTGPAWLWMYLAAACAEDDANRYTADAMQAVRDMRDRDAFAYMAARYTRRSQSAQLWLAAGASR